MWPEGSERGGGARQPTRFFDQPRYRNLPPPPDAADYPLIDDFEVIPVVAPPFGLEMRWQRASGEVLILFPWYDVADLEPALDRDHPPVGTMQEPWFHIDQGWFYMALEDDGEVIVQNGDDIGHVTDRFRVPAADFRSAWAAGYERILDL